MPWQHSSGRQSDMSPEHHRQNSNERDWTWYEPPKPAQTTSMFPSIPVATSISSSLTSSSTTISSGRYVPSKPLPRWVKVLFLTAFLTAISIVALIAFALSWRGNLSISSRGIAWIGMPPVQTPSGVIYRASDVERVFMGRDTREGPERLVPDATIGNGHFAGLNLVSPSGDLTIKGDVFGSRISVPNGTLTIAGDIGQCTLMARRIVTHGWVAKTRETASSIENTGNIGADNDFRKTSGLDRHAR